MFKSLATTQAGCRRSFPRHLLHRITTLAISVFAALVAQVIYTQPANAKSSGRPNIVFIMADDHACNAISAYGGRLAKSGSDAEYRSHRARRYAAEQVFRHQFDLHAQPSGDFVGTAFT